jgi:hypothetical protein
MVPGRHDIDIYRDATFTLPGIARKNSSDVYINFQTAYLDKPSAGLGKIDLVVRPPWKNRATETKQTPLLTLSTVTGEITVATTLISISIPASKTKLFSFNSGVYELELHTGDAEPIMDILLYGKFTVYDRMPLTIID